MDDRRLPLMCSELENRVWRICMLIPSIAGEQPKVPVSATVSKRPLRNQSAHLSQERPAALLSSSLRPLARNVTATALSDRDGDWQPEGGLDVLLRRPRALQVCPGTSQSPLARD